MSAETIESPVTATGASTASTPGMGGTEHEETAGAGDAQETETEGNAEGVSPEGGAGAEEASEQGAKNEPVSGIAPEDEERIAQADAIARTITGDPKRLKAYQAWLREDQGGGSAEAGVEQAFAESEAAIDEWFASNPANQQAMRAILKPLRGLLERNDRRLGGIEPAVRKASEAVVAGEFQRGIGDPALLRDKGFLQHLSAERRDPSFRRVERADPAYAGKLARERFDRRNGTLSANAQTNKRTADLKAGRLHAGNGTSAAGAKQIHVIDDTKQGWETSYVVALTAAEKSGAVVKLKSDLPPKS